MSPYVAPSKEEEHRDLGDEECADERLSSNDWEEEEGQDAGCKAVLEPAELEPRDPVFTFL